MIWKGFEIKLHRAGDSYPQFFVPSGSVDDDGGGWMLKETQKNLDLCIEEKTWKIAPYRHGIDFDKHETRSGKSHLSSCCSSGFLMNGDGGLAI
jgi:hypothetical protein